MKYILILFSILYFNSCTNVSYNQPTNSFDIKVTSNLKADINVGDDITGKGTETIILWFFRLPGKRFKAEGNIAAYSSSSPSTTKIPIVSSIFNSINVFNVIENAKGQAIHDAITLANADLIINPKFTITEDDFFIFKTVKCEVKGKKGTIKSIK
tara:strand:- start:201 stop:665 length:465 start_codon:yes stop_codon:yes gene_type:complete